VAALATSRQLGKGAGNAHAWKLPHSSVLGTNLRASPYFLRISIASA